MSIKYRLIIMNFLQFFVWGSWLISLGGYMGRELHFEGGQISMKAERTLAVQIPAELFERLKEYLAARNLKQKQFLIQLIESALEDTEKE